MYEYFANQHILTRGQAIALFFDMRRTLTLVLFLGAGNGASGTGISL